MYVVICTDDVVGRRGYSDHFVMMCVCVWVCMLAWLKENPWSEWFETWHSSARQSLEAYWFWVQKVNGQRRGTGSSFQTSGTPSYPWNEGSYKVQILCTKCTMGGYCLRIRNNAGMQRLSQDIIVWEKFTLTYIMHCQMKSWNSISVILRTTVGPQRDVIQSNFDFWVGVDLHLYRVHILVIIILKTLRWRFGANECDNFEWTRKLLKQFHVKDWNWKFKVCAQIHHGRLLPIRVNNAAMQRVSQNIIPCEKFITQAKEKLLQTIQSLDYHCHNF